ncbi:DivIVA domain-containing protein [Kytococcus sp. Marseille-QA3725]
MVVVVIALLLCVVAWVAAVVIGRLPAGEGALPQELPADAAVHLPDGPLRGEDLRGLRLPITIRGYRMAEVDDALRRMAEELEARDRALEAARRGDPVA